MIEIQRLATIALVQVMLGKNLDHALTEARKQAKGQLTDHERAALQDIGYGVQRFRQELENVLQPLYLKRKPDPPIDALLVVGAYQLLHTRMAPHAVVSHAVEVAALFHGPGAKGFVNGVLRNLLRQREALLELSHATPEGKYSHPHWWIETLQRQYPQEWEEILLMAQQHPPMTLRVNRRHSNRDQYQQRLSQAGITSRPVGKEGLILSEPVVVNRLPGFAEGHVSVQDAAAQYAPHLLGLHGGQRVLDACAAPGGKAAHILELISDIQLWALDKDAGRVKKMEANFERMGMKAHCAFADATRPEDWWDGVLFDRILLDAPCSGSGVVRRHPDIKWLRRPEDIPALAAVQGRLLETLWPLVRKGGRLVYSTCSLFREENQEQRDRFLGIQSDARLLPVQDSLCREGQIHPDRDHDGFFYAVFQKI